MKDVGVSPLGREIESSVGSLGSSVCVCVWMNKKIENCRKRQA